MLLAEIAYRNQPSLKRWIEFIEALPESKFNFGSWREDWSGHQNVPSLHLCTTSACAAGWLPTMWPKRWIWAGRCPVLRDRRFHDPAESVAEFFGIPERVAERLVVPNDISQNMISAKQWAKRARRILRRNGIKFE